MKKILIILFVMFSVSFGGNGDLNLSYNDAKVDITQEKNIDHSASNDEDDDFIFFILIAWLLFVVPNL